MKLMYILTVWYLLVNCFKVIDSRQYRLIFDDELYPYSIDKSVPYFAEYFSIEHLTFELIDDDTVRIGGYGECVKGMDPNLLFQFNLRTQYREQSLWYEGPIRMFIPNACAEGLNPSRPWYNITKLWTSCPPKKGDKWFIETQIINIQIALPPSFSVGPWKCFFLFTQGLLGAVTKLGTMAQVEFVEVF